MTSRTNRHAEGRNQGGTRAAAFSDLEHRRQLAVARYLDGDPIAVICQEMGCAKSWLYKWKKRYRAAESTWSQERSRRPKTTPSKTPEAIAAALIALRQTLSPDGSATVSGRYVNVSCGSTGFSVTADPRWARSASAVSTPPMPTPRCWPVRPAPSGRRGGSAPPRRNPAVPSER